MTMRNSTRLSFFALLGTALAGVALAADWPQWRGPGHDGKSAEKGVIKKQNWEESPPELQWKVEGMGSGYSSVSVADGKVYTTGNFDGGQGVVAVDTKEGKVLWKTTLTDSVPEHGSDGARCVPTVDDGHLYVITSNGAIACLTTGGEVKWQKDFKEWDGKMMSGWGFSESPLVDGDAVICTPGGKEAMMVALDKKTGGVKWKTEMPEAGPRGNDGAGYGSVVISNGAGVKQYVQMTGRGVIGVRAADGVLLWSYNQVANGTANIPTPVISGDLVFCSTGYGTGSALLRLKKADDSGVDAEEVYFLKPGTLQNHHGGLILHDGHIYGGHGHNDGKPICVEMATGDVKWGPEKGAGHGSAGVMYVDGHLIFRYQSGHVALIEATPAGYKLKGAFMPDHQERESWAHPVVSDGKLYLREQNVLMCYEL